MSEGSATAPESLKHRPLEVNYQPNTKHEFNYKLGQYSDCTLDEERASGTIRNRLARMNVEKSQIETAGNSVGTFPYFSVSVRKKDK